MYMMVKHLHLTAVALSLTLFVLRFFWTVRGSQMMSKKWVKIVPHVIDTVLLLSALTLCVLISQYPFVNAWLTEKVLGVVLYILMGFWTLKWARTTPLKALGFVGALAWLVFVAKVAVFKQPLLFA